MRREERWKRRNVRWHGSGRRLMPLTVASIMMTVLFLSGCGTCRKASEAREENVRHVLADSLRSELRQTWTEPVPQEEAKLEISLAELTNLPEKAEYRAKTGRASATVKKKGGTIVVYATCDSLQRQCEYLERQLSLSKSALDGHWNAVRTEEKRRSNGWMMPLFAFIVGVATGIVSTIKTRKIWQNRRNSCTA